MFRWKWLCACCEHNIDGRCAIENLVHSVRTRFPSYKFLNKLQCKLLLELLSWIAQEVQRVNPVEDGQVIVDWQMNLVDRAEHLIDSSFQASWERLETYPRLIVQSSGRFLFEPLIRELLLCATIIFASRQLKYGFEAIELFEKLVEDEYEANWMPKLIEATQEDNEILQLKVAEKVAKRRDESAVPQYLLRRLRKEFCTFEVEASNGGDVNSDVSGSTIMYLDEADVLLEPVVRIGQGSFGKVYKVKWRGIFCALKVFPGVDNASFETEVQALSTLCHPHIVQFIGCLKNAHESSLLMELMDTDLTDLLRTLRRKFDIGAVVDITLQVAEGMRYLHDKHIVHRDLKAANILVKTVKKNADLKKGGWIAKLTDFGLARTKFDTEESMNSQNHVGTTMWMAPELFKELLKGGRNIAPTGHFPRKADVFSFGITCFEILTGEMPYNTGQNDMKTLRQEIASGRRPSLPENCPHVLQDLIRRCWDSRPDSRPEFSEICIMLTRLKTTLFAGQCKADGSFRSTCGLRPRDPRWKISEKHMDSASDIESRGKIEAPLSPKLSHLMSRTGSSENATVVAFLPKLRQLITHETSLKEFKHLLKVFGSFLLDIHDHPEILHKFQALIAQVADSDYCQRCIDAYEKTRIAYCKDEWQKKFRQRKHHQNYLQISTPDSMNEISWEELQSIIDSWARDLEDVKVLYGNERRLVMEIFRDLGEPVWVGCFNNIAKPEFQKLMRFGDNFSKIEPSFQRLSALLDMFASIDNCKPIIHQVFAGLPCAEVLSQYLELSNKVVDAAASDFCEGIEVWMEEQKDIPSSGGKTWRLCSYVIGFLEYLLKTHQKTLGKVLRIKQGLRDKEEMPWEKSLSQGLTQILQTLQRLVKAHAAELQDKDSVLGDTFLENNMHYIYKRVRDSMFGPLVDLEQLFDPSIVGMVIIL